MSPFDDNNIRFVVLVNHEGQRSLWPCTVPCPAGWTSEFGPQERQVCLAYVEQHWLDMRPRSLVKSLNAPA